MTSPQDHGGSGDQLDPGFEVVRRGYARDQVDAHLTEVERRLRAAENARRMAERHAASLNDELHELRAATPPEGFPAPAPAAVAQPTFGVRVEKVLRLAEREATEIRARAAREAAAILEQAHAAAAEARAEAEHERAVAAQLRRENAYEGRTGAEAGGALAELGAVRENVRAELARLHALLGAELAGLDDRSAPAGRAEPAERPTRAGSPGPATEPAPDQQAGPDTRVAAVAVPTARRPGDAAAAEPPSAPDGSGPGRQAPPEREGGPEQESLPDDPEPAESDARPAWRPTPGTADLFARQGGPAQALR